MASTNYTGRTVDLLIMQNVKPVGQQAISLGLGGDVGGLVCTGAQKAAQYFVTALLTTQGTVKGDAAAGTLFMPTVYRGINDLAALRIAFNSAADTVLTQQDRYVTNATPDDEVLTAIELLDAAVDTDRKITLTVQLTTRAGDTRLIYVPINLAIR